MSIIAKDEIEYMMENVETNGVACSTVKDGHVIVFKKDKLLNIINNSDNETIVFFIKRPDFTS